MAGRDPASRRQQHRQVERQFGLLGIRATRPLGAALSTWAEADLVLVDADQGLDDLLPQTEGASGKPLVALLGLEAPGRIAWAMEMGAAIIPKPVAASAIFPALVMAVSIHQERRVVADKLRYLEQRPHAASGACGGREAACCPWGLDEEGIRHAPRLRRAASP